MSKAKNSIYEDNLVLFDKLIEACPEIERKGKTSPYTSANGYMFSQLNKAGEVGIRLPKEEGEKFMKEYQTTLFKSYGAVMRGYVLVPNELLEDTATLKKYLKIGHEYVKSLESKPTKKK